MSSTVIRVSVLVIESISIKLDGVRYYMRVLEMDELDSLYCEIVWPERYRNSENTRSLYHGVALQLDGFEGQTSEI